MKRALTERQIAEIEQRSQLPIEGTYEALRREGYPRLNAPVEYCSGADALTAMRSAAARERERGNDKAADFIERTINALAIPESEGIN